MKSVRRFATGVILVICLGAPILEMADRWDHTLQDGNDTESNLVIVALCVGAAFAVAGALLARVRASVRSRRCPVITPESTPTTMLTLAAPIPNSRPPTPLRV